MKAAWLICKACGDIHGDWEAYCQCGRRDWREMTASEREHHRCYATGEEATLLEDAHATGLSSPRHHD